MASPCSVLLVIFCLSSSVLFCFFYRYGVTYTLRNFFLKKQRHNFNTATWETKQALLELQHLEGMSDEENLGSTLKLLEAENLSLDFVTCKPYIFLYRQRRLHEGFDGNKIKPKQCTQVPITRWRDAGGGGLIRWNEIFYSSYILLDG